MKHQAPKTVLCIHDLSAVGRCSMAVIAPVLSTMGHQAVALPTALLSTHTGGLGIPARLNSEDFGLKAIQHYQQLGLSFDCIYSGYLAEPRNQQLVLAAYDAWPDALKIADPVLGDGGRIYTGMENMLPAMREVCMRADLVTPNLTEACLLLDRSCPEGETTAEELQQLTDGLSGLYRETLITGVRQGRDLVSIGCGEQDFSVRRLALDRSYPGTGDLFGAVLTGALLRGNALSAAADAAAGFVSDAIKYTDPSANPALGVWFEPILGRLCNGGI